ncbi:MarR family transcriptional regulator [Nocardiopsis sp. CNR-923]|uniref:MarR family winged helix-turn-helix transcriptional regulator n=1 Tax=Nocardiopsis sp. CNR-923 TaxID=1904965 RepID=UPI000962D3E9|nr:MarR family transcriptional regulator [Nocardiopsis sp. CNR-923]OLT25522.1 MarR family transcriptional regulator [Nocardiopsis sp. CNR-923]
MRDEVDGLIEAWRAERPDVDVTPLEVFSRVSRLARHLDRARRTVFTEHSLEPWEFDVLAELRRSGPPYELSPGRLLRATLVTSGTMTNRVDRLAAAGLVRRRPDPADKRGVLVRLTEKGAQRIDAALASLVRYEESLLAPMPDQDRARLASLLRSLLVPLDREPSGPQG